MVDGNSFESASNRLLDRRINLRFTLGNTELLLFPLCEMEGEKDIE